MKLIATLWFLAQMGFGTADISTTELNKTSGIEESTFSFAEVREQVADFVTDFELEANATRGEAIIAFTLSEDREVEVLDVITEDAELEKFIRQSLHGKQVQASQFIAGMPFSIKMTFIEK